MLSTSSAAPLPEIAARPASVSSTPESGVTTVPFVQEFRAAHGRAPRVLHIGNIANNAYLNAKILNRHGFDCDVICYDYYHIMGCPEWEECDFDEPIADHFRPDWSALNLKGYERPRWFAQGPRHICIDYLLARRTGNRRQAERLWRDLGSANQTIPRDGRSALSRAVARLQYWRARARDLALRSGGPDAYDLAWWKLHIWADSRRNHGYLVAAVAAPLVIAGLFVLRRFVKRGGESAAEAAARWVETFARAFPERADRLTANECIPYVHAAERWHELFAHYDIIQAYSTDVALPMFAGKRPYVGFEHGTLRVFTLADNALSRITALGYHCADHVMITNGDCLPYAQQIKVKAYTPMPHPFDDAFMSQVADDTVALHREHGVKYLFLCPLRHDWAIKGTDKYIRALPQIVEAIGRDFRLIMTEWGSQVDASRQLAESLGVADLIVWRQPFNRVQLVRHLKSVDIVFDQIALPCFGGTAPQAIGVGVPVTMSYDPASTEWLIPEAAPILSAWTTDDIVSAVKTALDPAWRVRYKAQAARWYDEHHSAREVVRKHADAYTSICRTTGLLPAQHSAA
jgi:hypothetical protein